MLGGAAWKDRSGIAWRTAGMLALIEKDIDQNDIWTNPAWDGLMV